MRRGLGEQAPNQSKEEIPVSFSGRLRRARRSRTTDPRPTLSSATRSPARVGQIALGMIWCIDGLFKLQPFFFSHFVSGVIDPSATGQPAVIGDPITWIGNLIRPGQSVFVVAAVLGEISIGIALLAGRMVKPMLLFSFVWALNVWLTGEGLGFLLAHQTPDPAVGILGTAPMYIVAGLLVWPRDARSDGSEPSFGVFGERGARFVWAALWLGAAVLWLFPEHTGANAISGTLTGAPSGAGWLTGLHSDTARLFRGSGTTAAVVLAVISAEIALSVLFARGTRMALLASIVLSLTFWLFAEGLGGLFTGQATDVGTSPLMILIAALLLPLATRRSPVTVPARVQVLPARQS